MLTQAPYVPIRRLAVLAACSVTAMLAALPAAAQTVSAPLTVTTFAGAAGQTGTQNGTGSAARFFLPTGIIIDSSGNLIVADAANNIFRKITPAGVVTTFSGSPVDPANRPINVGSADGAAADASFYIGDSSTTPGSNTMGLDGSGNLYFADTLNNTVRKIAPSGAVTTLAGSPGGQGTADGSGGNARFLVPYGVGVDASGNVYIADSGNNTIRKLTGTTVTTFAGTGRTFGSTDGTGAAARFSNPSGIAVDASGNLYVTDTGNHTVRKISPAGVVTTLAGSPGLSGSADGSGSQARFNAPTGIAVDSSGNLYVADTGNNLIRKISPAGTVATVAGSVGVAGTADGVGANAQFNQPYGLAVDSSGTLFIADTGNNTIRRAVATSGSGSLQITGVPPEKVQLNTGATFTLKVVATGSPSPSYQWTKDGAAISGATTSTLSLSGVTSANAGNYSVVVTSGVLTYTSAPTLLQVFASSVPVPSVTVITQPSDRSITVGQSTTFTVEATSSSPLSYQWTRNGVNIFGATNATYTIAAGQVADSGNYAVTITDGNSTVTTTSANLTVTGTTPAVPPVFSTQPSSQSVASGGNVTFTAAASGTPSPTYQWQKNGTALTNSGSISGANTSTLTITGATAADAGSYTVVAANSGGSVSSNAATLTITNTPPPPPPGPNAWLSNLSVRTTMQAGQSPLIVGLTVTGGSKNILVRGAGPALGALLNMSSGFMVDPRLDLYAAGATSASFTNDNWDASLAATFTSVGAFPFPAGSKDAAFVQSLNGGYTVQIPANGPGMFLVEAYDTAPGVSSPRLMNISARNQVGTGDNILIEGFAIRGTGTMRLLIRAVGPKLTDYGVTGILADPKLEIYNSSQVKIAENDNWDSSLASTFSSVGAFQLQAGSKDAATVVTLQAGTTYTVQVKGADGGTGQALVEIYELP